MVKKIAELKTCRLLILFFVRGFQYSTPIVLFFSSNPARWMEIDETNNGFNYDREIRYAASLKSLRRYSKFCFSRFCFCNRLSCFIMFRHFQIKLKLLRLLFAQCHSNHLQRILQPNFRDYNSLVCMWSWVGLNRFVTVGTCYHTKVVNGRTDSGPNPKTNLKSKLGPRNTES